MRDLIWLRILVASLGETCTPPWWRTQFLTDAGLRTTARIFPRTAVASAVNSVSEAARLEHDKKVGVGRRYHLFRLPTQWEERISTELTEQANLAELKHVIVSGRDALLRELESLARKTKPGGQEGPVLLGSAIRIGEPKAIAELAGYYLHAFTANLRCYPYFEEQERRT